MINRVILAHLSRKANELRDQKFQELASGQRGAPEHAMLDIQMKYGGGVLSVVVESVGDITNRIADRFSSLQGQYGCVKDKVEKCLQYLRHPYGFVKEYRENVANNANGHGIPVGEFQSNLDAALKKYADAHRNLKVYNAPQMWARDAAVAVGEQNFSTAEYNLKKLEHLLQDKETYIKAVGEFNP